MTRPWPSEFEAFLLGMMLCVGIVGTASASAQAPSVEDCDPNTFHACVAVGSDVTGGPSGADVDCTLQKQVHLSWPIFYLECDRVEATYNGSPIGAQICFAAGWKFLWPHLELPDWDDTSAVGDPCEGTFHGTPDACATPGPACTATSAATCASDPTAYDTVTIDCQSGSIHLRIIANLTDPRAGADAQGIPIIDRVCVYVALDDEEVPLEVGADADPIGLGYRPVGCEATFHCSDDATGGGGEPSTRCWFNALHAFDYDEPSVILTHCGFGMFQPCEWGEPECEDSLAGCLWPTANRAQVRLWLVPADTYLCLDATLVVDAPTVPQEPVELLYTPTPAGGAGFCDASPV